jgi:predicted phosphodiesterase
MQRLMNETIAMLRPHGPLLVFGGPYSNLEATAAVLEEGRRLGILPDRIICTGDVVAYGADASATVQMVRNSGCHVVKGNCEESLAAGASDCGCGFPEGSACQQLSRAWFIHADRELDSRDRAWMATLPSRIDIEIGGKRLAVVHGSARSINQFVFASTPAATKASDLDLTGADGIISGHCGLPYTQVVDGRLWHNSGAIGMPANDGTSRVWFSILDLKDDRGISIRHHAIAYDYRTAAAKMRQAALPEGYAEALETGLWPSCDVLPLKEIRERGVAIEEGAVVWRSVQVPQQAPRRKRTISLEHLWPRPDRDNTPRLSDVKFKNPTLTANGERRASIALQRLKTLWINTGTLCNIACRNCYIESSPKNDRLVYISRVEVTAYLDEIARDNLQTEEIGFTGGEPFMNPDMIPILEECLARGFKVLVLTNAMLPMQRHKEKLLDLHRRFGSLLTVRVSLDHYTAERHEDERGPKTFRTTLSGLTWLSKNGFQISVAGRTMWGEDEFVVRAGYARLFSQSEISIAVDDLACLTLFPEMQPAKDVPEITTACWDILHKSPGDVMCSSSRMVVKRKGSERPTVLACTLLPYDEEFELGYSLKGASGDVPLNHPFCAQFCVLGGASCSGKQ